MMILAIIPTLAADWVGLVIVLVMLGGSAISYIYKEAKKADEMRKARLRRQMEESGERPLPLQESTSGSSSADELAARRRRELAALARRQRPATLPSADSTQPSNLTVRQAQERAIAKVKYEERVQILRQTQTASPQAPSPGTLPPPRPVQRQTPSSASPFPARPNSARSAPAVPPARPTAASASRRRASAQRTISRQPLSAAGSTRSASPPQPELAQAQNRGEDPVNRQVSDAEPVRHDESAVAFIPRVSVGKSRIPLNSNNMQAALILSEILRPPVSLREP